MVDLKNSPHSLEKKTGSFNGLWSVINWNVPVSFFTVSKPGEEIPKAGAQKFQKSHHGNNPDGPQKWQCSGSLGRPPFQQPYPEPQTTNVGKMPAPLKSKPAFPDLFGTDSILLTKPSSNLMLQTTDLYLFFYKEAPRPMWGSNSRPRD